MERNVVAGKGKEADEKKVSLKNSRDELARNRVPTGNEITGK